MKLLGTVLVALLVTSCSGGSTPKAASTTTTTEATTTSAAPVGPVGDVVVKRCGPDAANGTTGIDLVVTNHGTDAATYAISIDVRDTTGVAGQVVQNVNGVAPGATVDAHTSSSAVGDNLRCVVTKVQRFPS